MCSGIMLGSLGQTPFLEIWCFWDSLLGALGLRFGSLKTSKWLLKFIRAQISHEVPQSEIKQFHIQFHTTLSHHISDGFGAHAFQMNYVKHLLPCDMFLQVFQTARLRCYFTCWFHTSTSGMDAHPWFHMAVSHTYFTSFFKR